MPEFFKLFYPKVVYERISPLFFDLLMDPVAIVREESYFDFLDYSIGRTKALPAYFKLLMDYDHSMFIHELQKFCDLYNNEDYMIREVSF